MRYAQEARNLRVQIDCHHCELTPAAVDKMIGDLESVGRQVENFPYSDINILVEYNSRSNDYSVKVVLVLPGARLVGNDHDLQLHAAYERILAGLEQNIRAYKERLGNWEERQKQEEGTHQEVEPTVALDLAALDAAVREGNYAAFRAATFPYEESVRKRAGRWVERYPELNAAVGRGIEIADLVEEVFLNAFEGYESRPQDVRFGDWLESLIDPAVKQLVEHRDEELENINMARAARAAEQGPEAV
jgi:ribosome-associated translation inhibitor RaiA